MKRGAGGPPRRVDGDNGAAPASLRTPLAASPETTKAPPTIKPSDAPKTSDVKPVDPLTTRVAQPSDVAPPSLAPVTPTPIAPTTTPDAPSEPPEIHPDTLPPRLLQGAKKGLRASERTAAREPPWLLELEAAPYHADFHLALRRMECLYPDRPRLGEGMRPSDEPLRIGQDPSMAFAPSAVTSFRRGKDGVLAKLSIAFMGMFGPRGALPLHLTEYARDRMRNSGDATFASFVDIFHHRMLVLFHRAWAAAQPTVCQDRSDTNRFTLYVGALFGLALRASQERDSIPDRAKLHYAARLAAPTRNAEGLEAMVSDYFRMPCKVQPFIGEWITLPPDSRWRLGYSREFSTLGNSTILGARVWQCDHKFRLLLGPLRRAQFQTMLPGAESLTRLAALVRAYVGDEFDWEVRLMLADGESSQLKLGGATRLGWNARLGYDPGSNEDLLVNPSTGRTQRVARENLSQRRMC